jgi:fumarylacetoacetate (FAA) hydrolase
MKLASLNDGSKDGQLIVVSKDLRKFIYATDIALTMQNAMDNWDSIFDELNNLSKDLNDGKIEANKFEAKNVLPPLPRAYQWADGSAYVNHVALVRKARGAEMPDSFWSDPLMYQGGSDDFIPPLAPICLPDESWGIDMEGEIAVITGDVKMGTSPTKASNSIRLLMLVNDVSLRNLIPNELSKGFGFFQSKPSTAFSPVAVTPDELGDFWKDGKVHNVLEVDLNNEPLGRVNSGIDMTFNFPELISHACKSRNLGAGTIIGSGTVSNRDSDGGPGKSIKDGGLGYSCIAEIRMVETILKGKPLTPFMKFGDTTRIDMKGKDGSSIFGEIKQIVEKIKI